MHATLINDDDDIPSYAKMMQMYNKCNKTINTPMQTRRVQYVSEKECLKMQGVANNDYLGQIAARHKCHKQNTQLNNRHV
jgi:hypothetical protein